jgi:hypothetical protein
MFEPITFVVEGRAVTQGSKNPNVPKYGDGTLVLRHKRRARARLLEGVGAQARDGGLRLPADGEHDRGQRRRLEPWREAIGWAAKHGVQGRAARLLCVMSLVFVKPRPKAHYGTGRNAEVLKDSAPAAPGVKPDTGKLARAVEDALTACCTTTTRCSWTPTTSKRYCHRWEPERVIVTLRPAAFQTVGDLVAAGQLELPSRGAAVRADGARDLRGSAKEGRRAVRVPSPTLPA